VYVIFKIPISSTLHTNLPKVEYQVSTQGYSERSPLVDIHLTSDANTGLSLRKIAKAVCICCLMSLDVQSNIGNLSHIGSRWLYEHYFSRLESWTNTISFIHLIVHIPTYAPENIRAKIVTRLDKDSLSMF